ncbi:MAG TPA: TonB-dependent receptor [Sphingomonas sp.]|jgi:iron complex outermembrane receptor protein|uniref:TonB-dependent receptor n=1 Tax=Sphingomonas sp. TaxID=28214 RepID=UPI002ED85655
MRLWKLLAGAGMMAMAAVTHAQERAPDPALADTTADAGSADIVVTAQRRSESIQRVPVSLTAVTADTLRAQQINDLTQLTRAAPTLQIGGDSTFAVRGVGTISFSGTIDSSVALAIDDVNYARPILNSAKFMDLERVEVLNGPQGLLFGKNASAGLLNIVTARPKLGQFSSVSEVELSSRETPGADRIAPGLIGRQTLNIPLGSIAALRINALYGYEEPPISFVGTVPAGVRDDINRRSYQVKGKLLIEPNDAWSIYAIGDYNKLTGTGGLFNPSYRRLATGSNNLAPLTAVGITASPANFLFAGEGGYYRDIDTGGAQVSVTHTLDSGIEISNLAAWRYYGQSQQLDIDGTAQNAASLNRAVGRYDQYSDELRVALPAGNRLTGQVGLYAFKSTLDYDTALGGNNYLPTFVARGFPFCVGATAVAGARPPTCSVSNALFLGSDRVYTLDTESLAGFGQLTYALTDALKLIAGGRVTRDTIDIDLTQGRFRYFVPLGGPSVRIVQDYANTNFSWKLGAQYQATPAIMAYGFYGRGYKGPGFNDQAPNAAASLVVRPEISNTGEFGVKSSFLDRRLTVNVSLFTTKFSDFQVQSFDIVSQSFIVQNAAKVRSRGIETTIGLRPIEGLAINASGALLSSKFSSFPGAQCYPTQATRGCSATVRVFDAAGLTLPVSPKFTSTVQIGYDLPVSGDVVPFIGGDWYHRSSINYAINRSPATGLGAIDLFGMTAGVRVGDNLRFSLFCKNCTNRFVPTSLSTDAGDATSTPNKLTNLQTFNLDSVRTIGTALRFGF